MVLFENLEAALFFIEAVRFETVEQLLFTEISPIQKLLFTGLNTLRNFTIFSNRHRTVCIKLLRHMRRPTRSMSPLSPTKHGHRTFSYQRGLLPGSA